MIDEKAFQELRLVVYDFDGVMTNNRSIVLQDGTEGVIVNKSDGWGTRLIRELGLAQLILSTEKNPVVSARGKKLNIPVVQGSEDKLASLKEYCEENHFSLNEILYVGNDTNDLEVMKAIRISVAPKDAHGDILEFANVVTSVNGGDGVVREVADLLVKHR